MPPEERGSVFQHRGGRGLHGRQVVLGYTGRAGAPSSRTVSPLGLVTKSGVWYLVAGTDAGTRRGALDGLPGEIGLYVEQLGLSPVAAIAGGLTFSSVQVGGFHTCGITTARVVYCWGDNSEGQLGSDVVEDFAVEPRKLVGQP